ncbi:MAG: diguanylate cyclase [Candidatus Aureabacteria bacterium]|nr:diguanylate cyclase [Candidatus Auribacterota bacterium]
MSVKTMSTSHWHLRDWGELSGKNRGGKRISEGIFLEIKSRLIRTLYSKSFKFLVLLVYFLCLIIFREVWGTFGISLGYLYIPFIFLSGFWFGLPGGIIAAAAASATIVTELIVLKDFPYRELAAKGLAMRILAYLFGGILVGYIASKIQSSQETLKEMAYHDGLTGCLNYRHIIELLEGEITRSERFNRELAVIMLDVDNLKQINDTYGHLLGNKVLKTFADILKKNIRRFDLIARFGGDEFLVVLPETDLKKTLEILHRVKKELINTRIKSNLLKGESDLFIEFSAGVSAFPHNGKGLKELVSGADSALYQAKIKGRNQIVFERRAELRIKPYPDFKIEFGAKAQGKPGPIDIDNISTGGMLLVTAEHLPPDEFKCRLYSKEKPVDVKCRVLHKKRKDKDQYYVGTCFVDIPVHFREELEGMKDKKRKA